MTFAQRPLVDLFKPITSRSSRASRDPFRLLKSQPMTVSHEFTDRVKTMDAAESSTFNGILLPIIVILTLLLLYYLKPRAKLNIKGKYVLITGCDSGFGRATAIALDKMGVCVLATCLTKEGEQSLKSVTSDKLKTFQLDVTNSEQIKKVLDKVNKLLVNGNAGEYPCSIFAFYCRIVDIIACYPVNSKFFFQGIPLIILFKTESQIHEFVSATVP